MDTRVEITDPTTNPTEGAPRPRFSLILGGFEAYCEKTTSPCSFPEPPVPVAEPFVQDLWSSDIRPSFSFLHGGFIESPQPPSPSEAEYVILKEKEHVLFVRTKKLDAREAVVDAREAVVDAREADIGARETDIDAREAVVDAREAVINAAQTTIEATQKAIDATQIRKAKLSQPIELHERNIEQQIKNLQPSPPIFPQPSTSLSIPSPPPLFLPSLISVIVLSSFTILFRISHRRQLKNRSRNSSICEIAHVVGHEILFRQSSPSAVSQMDEDEVISMKTPAFKSKPRVSTFQPPISSPVPNLTSITPAEVERRFRRVDSDDESVAEISMEVGTSVEKKKLTEDFDRYEGSEADTNNTVPPSAYLHQYSHIIPSPVAQ